jgi:hypothetical protein
MIRDEMGSDRSVSANISLPCLAIRFNMRPLHNTRLLPCADASDFLKPA